MADRALAVDLDERAVRAAEVGEEHPAVAQRDPGGQKKLDKAFKFVEKSGGPSIDDLGTTKKKP